VAQLSGCICVPAWNLNRAGLFNHRIPTISLKFGAGCIMIYTMATCAAAYLNERQF
jgi:hypothetical protein